MQHLPPINTDASHQQEEIGAGETVKITGYVCIHTLLIVLFYTTANRTQPEDLLKGASAPLSSLPRFFSCSCSYSILLSGVAVLASKQLGQTMD